MVLCDSVHVTAGVGGMLPHSSTCCCRSVLLFNNLKALHAADTLLAEGLLLQPTCCLSQEPPIWLSDTASSAALVSLARKLLCLVTQVTQVCLSLIVLDTKMQLAVVR